MRSFFSNTKAPETEALNRLDANDLDVATLAHGRALLASIEAHQRKSTSLRKTFSDKLMDWAMSDPTFKVQLFRFVDVFPTLNGANQVHELLSDYLRQPGVNLPSGMDWGLKAGGIMKGTFAKSIASNITRMAETFIAGRTAGDAVPQLRRDWERGIAFSVDILGEACLSDAEADHYRERYLEMVKTLSDSVQDWPLRPTLETDHLGPVPRCNVSIKISSLAAQLKPHDFEGTVNHLLENLRPLLEEAGRRNVLINFDMEQSELKDLTLTLFERCCEQIDFPAGIALQAYLKSGPNDAQRLIDWSRRTGRQVTVRLIKGAYWDYEIIHAEQQGWPIPVWTNKADTDSCFEAMTRQFVSAIPRRSDEGGVKLALGSHNARSIAHAQAAIERADLPPSALEYQLLEGMAEGLRQALVDQQQRVRTYVPLGEMIPGMAYLVRRLLENTSNESWLRGGSDSTDEQRLASPSATTADELEPSETSRLPSQIGFHNEPLRDFADADQRDQFAEAVGTTTAPRMHPSKTLSEVEQAIATAESARAAWMREQPDVRIQMLQDVAATMRAERDSLAAQIISECGKTWQEADGDVCEAIDFCEYYAQQARHLFEGRQLGSFVGELNQLQYAGAGVAAIISPWNFPLAICTGMTAAALVTGNPALVKPAEQTTDIASRMCEIMWKNGVPRNVLQFVPGEGETVGATLVNDPRIDIVAFTGSRDVGFQILKTAGTIQRGQANVKRVVCEMGGKNAIIVDATADLDEAVVGVCHSAFGYAGQKCSACSRVIVVGDHYEPFLRRLVEMTRSLRVGDPRDPATDIGPVIDDAAARKIWGYIERGRETSQLRLGVEVPQDVQASTDRPLIGPHIFSDVADDDPLMTDEIFGPVLAVTQVATFDQALELANQGVYKLTGAVYSRTPSHLERARTEFRVGNLYLNRGSTGALVGRQAFGGFGHSGTGTKAGGPDYLLNFVYSTLVCENTMRRGFAPGLD